MDKLPKASRLKGIEEYYFSQKLREIEILNKEDPPVLNLGIGSPDMTPPESVKQALSDALNEDNYHRYQNYKGIPELREAFSHWYKNHYGISLDPQSEILPLMGSKEGIMHISMSLLNPRDEVLIPNPGYPAYAVATQLAGGIPRSYALREENGCHPDLYNLATQDLSKVKLMWVNYPHMPTGTPANEELYIALLKFSKDKNIVIINDNPYSFTLTKTPRSILCHRSKNDQVLELNSLSKSHNMAGWRVGVLSGHQTLIQQALTFKSNMDSGMFKPIQKAAIIALNQPKSWYSNLNKAYAERKVWIHQIANQLGCKYTNDQEGMFLWTKIPEGKLNGETYSNELLHQHKIFVPPGMIFGTEGDQFIRFSLCSTPSTLNEVLKRIS